MNLTKFLIEKGITQSAFAEKSGVPKSSLSEHVKYEAGRGGRPLGLDLCERVIEHGEGLVFLADLRPDRAALIRRILNFEAPAGDPA